jgi:hypothetical protein
MNWDIYIQDLPNVPTMADVPADHRPRPIGKRTELLHGVLTVIPFATQQDSDWVFAKNDTIDLSIQFHMEDAEHVRYMLVHVHGGEQSATCVSALLRHLGLRAHDTATGELFDGYGLEEAL